MQFGFKQNFNPFKKQNKSRRKKSEPQVARYHKLLPQYQTKKASADKSRQQR